MSSTSLQCHVSLTVYVKSTGKHVSASYQLNPVQSAEFKRLFCNPNPSSATPFTNYLQDILQVYIVPIDRQDNAWVWCQQLVAEIKADQDLRSWGGSAGSAGSAAAGRVSESTERKAAVKPLQTIVEEGSTATSGVSKASKASQYKGKDLVDVDPAVLRMRWNLVVVVLGVSVMCSPIGTWVFTTLMWAVFSLLRFFLMEHLFDTCAVLVWTVLTGVAVNYGYKVFIKTYLAGRGKYESELTRICLFVLAFAYFVVSMLVLFKYKLDFAVPTMVLQSNGTCTEINGQTYCLVANNNSTAPNVTAVTEVLVGAVNATMSAVSGLANATKSALGGK